jgi:hypothetical protein
MMSEDIHKWTDGRYTLMFDEHTFFVFDNEKEERMTALETTKKLNEQQDTITNLQEEKEYWESKAMTLLLQVRRLTSRMTDKEVKEFKKELEE